MKFEVELDEVNAEEVVGWIGSCFGAAHRVSIQVRDQLAAQRAVEEAERERNKRLVKLGDLAALDGYDTTWRVIHTGVQKMQLVATNGPDAHRLYHYSQYLRLALKGDTFKEDIYELPSNFTKVVPT